MENGGTGHQELLVARGDKQHKEVCRRMRPVPKDEK